MVAIAVAIVRDESVAMSVKSQMSIKPLSSNVSGKHKDRERLAAQSAWRVAGPNQVLILASILVNASREGCRRPENLQLDKWRTR
jgi:hypothetical protein